MYKVLFAIAGILVVYFITFSGYVYQEYHFENESVVEPRVVGNIDKTANETVKPSNTITTSTNSTTTTKKAENVLPAHTTSTPIVIKPEQQKQTQVVKRGISTEECLVRINNSPFYYDSSMQSVKKVNELSDAGNITDASILREISCNPQAIWLSGRDSNYTREKIRKVIDESSVQNRIPVFVLYNGPVRGTLEWQSNLSAEEYNTWIKLVADTVNESDVWIILEPDALALAYNLSENDRVIKLAELNRAVGTLVTYAPNARVYIDAGHSNWKSEKIAADYLLRAGVKYAHGFSLNVSNYQTTESQMIYGEKLSALVSGKHFIIDTSRNGNGPPTDNEWCNPTGRAIGEIPMINNNNSFLDALLWVKLPGESDGYCNGGTSPGKFWLEYALDLVKNQK